MASDLAAISRVKNAATAQPLPASVAVLSPIGTSSGTESTSHLTLIALCRSYAQSLKDNGKASSQDVSQTVERHIASSDLAYRIAKEITRTEFIDMLREVVTKISGHTAAKLRTLLHAAYARALRSKLDPSASKAEQDYGIETNPISGIDSLAQFKKARDRYLRDSEFREVWRHLQPDLKLSIPLRALRLCILLAGQRAEQLVSVTIDKVDLEAGTILLLDGKGRRTTPRQHLLPLGAEAKAEVHWLMNYAQSVKSRYLLPGSKQGTRVTAGSISNQVLRIRKDMEAKALCIAPFAFIDFRRTIETKLAALGVSKDHRAQIQSHGLSGVQTKHYDRHDYMREKQDALLIWEVFLNSLIRERPDT